jgi:hypothetical protein
MEHVYIAVNPEIAKVVAVRSSREAAFAWKREHPEHVVAMWEVDGASKPIEYLGVYRANHYTAADPLTDPWVKEEL